MKNNIPLVEQYYVQQKKYTNEKINNIEKLNLQLELAKQVLNDLRVYIRNNKFKDSDEEIDFFKHIKPNIYADFIFYNCLLKYHVNKPNATNSILKNYFKNELKKLESKKRKNLKFYQYYKHNSTFLDHLYFLRENKQLDLFSIDISIYLDSEFYTSHDKLAAEVIAYDLLTNFYKKEISKLKSISSGKFDDDNKRVQSTLNWTASKTDLIELVYALKVTGANTKMASKVARIIRDSGTNQKITKQLLSDIKKLLSKISKQSIVPDIGIELDAKPVFVLPLEPGLTSKMKEEVIYTRRPANADDNYANAKSINKLYENSGIDRLVLRKRIADVIKDKDQTTLEEIINIYGGIKEGLPELFGYIGELKKFKHNYNTNKDKSIVFDKEENKTIKIPEIILVR